MFDFDFDVDSEVELSEFSSIGDSFTNLVYSLAVSQVLGKPVGKRVSNYILSQALIRSGLRDKAGRRLDKGGLADFAEGAIFYAWMQKRIALEECVGVLVKYLEGSKGDLREASITAFAELLKVLDERLDMD